MPDATLDENTPAVDAPGRFFSTFDDKDPAKIAMIAAQLDRPRNDDRKAKNTVTNLLLIADEDPVFAAIVRYDRAKGEITHASEFAGLDDLGARIVEYLDTAYSLETSEAKLHWLVNRIAYRNQYNSVIRAYEALGPAPVENPFDEVLNHIRLKNEPDHANVVEILDLFLKKATLQVYAPELADVPFPNDIIPVLKGPQGIGKTLTVAGLAIDQQLYWDAGTGDMDLAQRDEQLKLVGLDIAELGEYRGHKTAEKIKALASTTRFTFRPPYARGNVTIPRTVSLFGTTNNHAYLSDGTGNRRFYPIEIESVDFALFHENRDLFRQLRAWYRDWAIRFIDETGDDLETRLFDIRESAELTAHLNESRETARVISPSEDAIEEYVERVQTAVKENQFAAFPHRKYENGEFNEFYSSWEAAKLIYPSGRIPPDFYRVFTETMERHGFQYKNRWFGKTRKRAWAPKQNTMEHGTQNTASYQKGNEEEESVRGLETPGVPCSGVPDGGYNDPIPF